MEPLSKGLQSSKGENLEQKSIPSCRGLVDGPIAHHHKTKLITETRSRTIKVRSGDDVPSCMMQLSESREEIQMPIRAIVHPKQELNIGNWNVRTLYQASNSAQAGREMERLKNDILGINETHWTGQGKTQIEDKTIIYSGRDDQIHREGVAFMLSKNAVRSLTDWTPVNERIIKARFYSKHIKLTMIYLYAPTEVADDDVKEEFYTKLQELVGDVHQHNMLIITGDMNAKVGSNNNCYESIMGNHGIGQRNNNGERLCEFCGTNQLVITGTLFNHKNIHTATWNSPDGTTSNQIDHILVKRKFITSVTSVLRSAHIGSDHNLVCTTIKLKLAKTKKDNNSSSRIRFDLAKLKRDDIKKKFVLSLKNKYEALGKLPFRDA